MDRHPTSGEIPHSMREFRCPDKLLRREAKPIQQRNLRIPHADEITVIVRKNPVPDHCSFRCYDPSGWRRSSAPCQSSSVRSLRIRDSLCSRHQHHPRLVQRVLRSALPGHAAVRQDLQGYRPHARRLRRRGNAGQLLRQHFLHHHETLRPVTQSQRPYAGASRAAHRAAPARTATMSRPWPTLSR